MLLHPGLVDAAEPPGEMRGEDQADGDRLPVPEVPRIRGGPVALDAAGGPPQQADSLQCVAQGVSVVEDDPAPRLPLVLTDDRRLDGEAARHLFLDRLVRARGLTQEGVLGHLSPSARPLARREGGQGLGVAEHGLGLPERADEVLAFGEVHTGLPADGGIHLGQERRRHVHVCRAPVVRGGGEAGHVGDDPPAHGDHHVRPRDAPRAKVRARSSTAASDFACSPSSMRQST